MLAEVTGFVLSVLAATGILSWNEEPALMLAPGVVPAPLSNATHEGSIAITCGLIRFPSRMRTTTQTQKLVVLVVESKKGVGQNFGKFQNIFF